MKLLNNISVEVVQEGLTGILANKVHAVGREDKDDAFFVADLGDIVRKYDVWCSQLPRVEPHYAVKCNDDSAVLSVLAKLGTGFDCASKAEIQKVMENKVSPSRIIYANPCKQTSHIRYAAKHKVAKMTFDNETELYKIKAVHPEAQLVLRILPPEDSKAQCPLGMKYGCDPKYASRLLRVAQELGLNVIGVSFHVGSGCYDPTAYSQAVASAHSVFAMGLKEGFNFTFLDIGGGFPGQKSAKVSFEEICLHLRPALDTYFPESSGVKIISEPGRFFVASAFTLATNVIAKRLVPRDGTDPEEKITCDDQSHFMYYVNDGVYGSFNCLLYDHAEVEPSLLYKTCGKPVYTSSIWGPTCDGLDCIRDKCELPELDIGDWIVFHDMGAYTCSAASTFNGMPKPKCYYVAQDTLWKSLKKTPIGFHLVTEMKTGFNPGSLDMDHLHPCLPPGSLDMAHVHPCLPPPEI
jgi:ornithine decarboxylase